MNSIFNIYYENGKTLNETGVFSKKDIGDYTYYTIDNTVEKNNIKYITLQTKTCALLITRNINDSIRGIVEPILGTSQFGVVIANLNNVPNFNTCFEIAHFQIYGTSKIIMKITDCDNLKKYPVNENIKIPIYQWVDPDTDNERQQGIFANGFYNSNNVVDYIIIVRMLDTYNFFLKKQLNNIFTLPFDIISNKTYKLYNECSRSYPHYSTYNYNDFGWLYETPIFGFLYDQSFNDEKQTLCSGLDISEYLKKCNESCTGNCIVNANAVNICKYIKNCNDKSYSGSCESIVPEYDPIHCIDPIDIYKNYCLLRNYDNEDGFVSTTINKACKCMLYNSDKINSIFYKNTYPQDFDKDNLDKTFTEIWDSYNINKIIPITLNTTIYDIKSSDNNLVISILLKKPNNDLNTLYISTDYGKNWKMHEDNLDENTSIIISNNGNLVIYYSNIEINIYKPFENIEINKKNNINNKLYYYYSLNIINDHRIVIYAGDFTFVTSNTIILYNIKLNAFSEIELSDNYGYEPFEYTFSSIIYNEDLIVTKLNDLKNQNLAKSYDDRQFNSILIYKNVIYNENNNSISVNIDGDNEGPIENLCLCNGILYCILNKVLYRSDNGGLLWIKIILEDVSSQIVTCIQVYNNKLYVEIVNNNNLGNIYILNNDNKLKKISYSDYITYPNLIRDAYSLSRTSFIILNKYLNNMYPGVAVSNSNHVSLFLNLDLLVTNKDNDVYFYNNGKLEIKNKTKIIMSSDVYNDTVKNLDALIKDKDQTVWLTENQRFILVKYDNLNPVRYKILINTFYSPSYADYCKQDNSKFNNCINSYKNYCNSKLFSNDPKCVCLPDGCDGDPDYNCKLAQDIYAVDLDKLPVADKDNYLKYAGCFVSKCRNKNLNPLMHLYYNGNTGDYISCDDNKKNTFENIEKKCDANINICNTQLNVKGGYIDNLVVECNIPGIKHKCESNSDCGDGKVCINNICKVPCKDDSKCDTKYCYNNYCEVPRWSFKNDICYKDIKGSYLSEEQCKNDCLTEGNTNKWECLLGNCVQVCKNGTYDDEKSCNDACNNKHWSCENGKCIKVDLGKGQYVTEEECNKECSNKPWLKWLIIGIGIITVIIILVIIINKLRK